MNTSTKGELETELVWLPKSLADKIEGAKVGGGDYESMVLGYIDASRAEVKNQLESLDDDVLMYRGLMVKAKQEFEKAKNEQLDASYALWEKFDKELPLTSEKVKKLTDEIAPIKKDIEDLNNALSNISSYQIKDLLDMMKEISDYLSYDSKTGDILKYLVKNYKK